MRKTIGLAMVALLGVSSQALTAGGDDSPMKGSGVSKEETRKVGVFRSVDISSTFEATVTIGPEARVTLDVEDNLLSLVKTEVIDGVLRVSFADGHSVESRKPEKITIVAPSLDAIMARGASKVVAKVGAETKTLRVEADGSAFVRVAGLKVDSIEVKAGDASHVELSGRGKTLALHLSGASKVTAGVATFESAQVRLDGASRGEVRVTGSIEVEASGACALHVAGGPRSRRIRTSGASRVTYEPRGRID